MGARSRRIAWAENLDARQLVGTSSADVKPPASPSLRRGHDELHAIGDESTDLRAELKGRPAGMSMGMREKNGKTGRLIEMKLLPGNRVLSMWRARQESNLYLGFRRPS